MTPVWVAITYEMDHTSEIHGVFDIKEWAEAFARRYNEGIARSEEEMSLTEYGLNCIEGEKTMSDREVFGGLISEQLDALINEKQPTGAPEWTVAQEIWVDEFHQRLAVRLIAAVARGKMDLTVRELYDILDLACEEAMTIVTFMALEE